MSTKRTDRAAYLAGRITAALADDMQRESLAVLHDDSGTVLQFNTRGVKVIVRVEVKE